MGGGILPRIWMRLPWPDKPSKIAMVVVCPRHLPPSRAVNDPRATLSLCVDCGQALP